MYLEIQKIQAKRYRMYLSVVSEKQFVSFCIMEYKTMYRKNTCCIFDTRLVSICIFALEAIPEIELAMRLDRELIPQFLHFLGLANLLAGKYETAAALLRQRIILVPGTDFTRAVLASALGHLGDVDDARRVWQELKEINPKY